MNSDPAASKIILEILIHALRVKDEKLNALASQAFVLTPAPTVPFLVRLACDRTLRPSHRVRILDVIGRIGVRQDVMSCLDLTLLWRDKNPAVRKAAFRAFAQTPPAAPEDLTSDRACSPA